jgi:16S rRNA (guanine966-N2)-methyltransferase
LAIVEESVEAAFKTPEGFEELERRAYDDSELIFLRAT